VKYVTDRHIQSQTNITKTRYFRGRNVFDDMCSVEWSVDRLGLGLM